MSISWQVVGDTVRGATHERNGLPNQDAIYWLPESGYWLPESAHGLPESEHGLPESAHGPSLVLTVADGHGSARYSRSHIGAGLAVQETARLVHEFLQSQAGVDNMSVIKHATEEWLPRAIVRRWSEAVAEHLKTEPLSRDELDSLDAASPVAYGSTLLVAAVTERFVLYLQLGDGEILTVNDTGDVVRPLTKDDRLFGNETTSLCATEAWRDFRVNFQPLTQSHPALILLSTDGYPNSFREEAGFMKVGSDLLHMIRQDGLASVKDHLAGWLRDSTRAGSGDDVTLGILCSVGSSHL